MTQPFVGQVQPIAFNFAPKNWALCNGQTLSIQQNTALFSLLGTYYGGNGVNTFMLPDLRSRVPISQGTAPNGAQYTIGQVGGVENVTLTQSTTPSHLHNFVGTSANASSITPSAGALLGTVVNNRPGQNPDPYYAPDSSPLQPLNPGTLNSVGNNQPHTNIQPYLAISWCIALYGIYPSRN
jgi:microcystin-dependent protein